MEAKKKTAKKKTAKKRVSRTRWRRTEWSDTKVLKVTSRTTPAQVLAFYLEHPTHSVRDHLRTDGALFVVVGLTTRVLR